MKKNTKILIIIAVACVGAVIFLLFNFSQKSPTIVPKTSIIFFYGRECPHCQEVEKFLQENKVAERVSFDSIEVWHNETNSNLLMEKVKICGLSEEKVGVPLLYVSGRCLVGAQPVEEFFRSVK